MYRRLQTEPDYQPDRGDVLAALETLAHQERISADLSALSDRLRAADARLGSIQALLRELSA